MPTWVSDDGLLSARVTLESPAPLHPVDEEQAPEDEARHRPQTAATWLSRQGGALPLGVRGAQLSATLGIPSHSKSSELTKSVPLLLWFRV